MKRRWKKNDLNVRLVLKNIYLDRETVVFVINAERKEE